MVERTALVNKKEMNYEGIFSVKALYEVIDTFAKTHGYIKVELLANEKVQKDGRYIRLVIELHKQMSEYAKSVLGIDIRLEHVRDVTTEHEGKKYERNQGKCIFVFDAFHESDFEHKWENKPGFFFIRILFDKYLFKPFITDFNGKIMTDHMALYNELRAHLHLHKY